MTEQQDQGGVVEIVEVKTPTRRAKTQPAAPEEPPKKVRFMSRNEEATQWNILGVTGLRDRRHPGRVVWNVPAELVPTFEKHFFVSNGRVQKQG